LPRDLTSLKEPEFYTVRGGMIELLRYDDVVMKALT
jgi:hypothetical protein